MHEDVRNKYISKQKPVMSFIMSYLKLRGNKNGYGYSFNVYCRPFTALFRRFSDGA